MANELQTMGDAGIRQRFYIRTNAKGNMTFRFSGIMRVNQVMAAFSYIPITVGTSIGSFIQQDGTELMAPIFRTIYQRLVMGIFFIIFALLMVSGYKDQQLKDEGRGLLEIVEKSFDYKIILNVNHKLLDNTN